MNRFGNRVKWGMLAAAIAMSAVIAPAAIGFEDTRVNRGRDGVGIRGYDPVAYFDGTPMAGSRSIEHTFEGTTYRFVNDANRDRFAKDPSRYVPQYGGFCAYAVSRGYTASIDPLAWTIVGGKLYLNYSKRVQKVWEADVPGNIARGDANWPGLASSTR